jgi:hypothetical protein
MVIIEMNEPDEIRTNTFVIFQNLLSSVVKQNSSGGGKIP